MIKYGKTIDQVISLKLLHTTYKNHHRLGVFHRKGVVCICCGAGKEGVYLVKNHTTTKKGHEGSHHVDIFTKGWILMTIDHIVPKSDGGDSSWNNLQPMCTKCNGKKASLLVSVEELRERLGIKNAPVIRAYDFSTELINTA